MKYRIRDTNTGKLVEHCHQRENMFLLSPCGTRILMYRGSDLFRMQGFKPEFEVSSGVYVDDYLLVYIGDIPSVYHIESNCRVNLVGTNIKYSGDVKSFLMGVDYEVIKCR